MSKYDGADEFIREVTKERPGKERERSERERGRSDRDRERPERERSDRDRERPERERERSERERERSGRDRERSERTERTGGPSRGNLSDRLIAISAEEKPTKPPGCWLTEQMEKYKKENGIESDSEPTEEDIKNQVLLPTKGQIENQSFKEPITNWVEVVPSKKVPSWSKAILPEEEIVKGPDWRPPTPPRVDISLISFTQHFQTETLPRTSTTTTTVPIPDKKMVLRGNFAENEEICYYDSACVIRTTMAALRKSERQGGGGDDRRREGGRGGRDDGGGGGRRGRDDNKERYPRSMSSSPGQENGDFRSREQRHNRDHSDHHSRRGRSRSPGRDRRNDWNNRRDERGDRDRGREDRNRPSMDGRRPEGERSQARDERRQAAPPGHNYQLPPNRNPSRPPQAPPAQPAVAPPSDEVPKTYREYKEWKARRAQLGLN